VGQRPVPPNDHRLASGLRSAPPVVADGGQPGAVRCEHPRITHPPADLPLLVAVLIAATADAGEVASARVRLEQLSLSERGAQATVSNLHRDLLRALTFHPGHPRAAHLTTATIPRHPDPAATDKSHISTRIEGRRPIIVSPTRRRKTTMQQNVRRPHLNTASNMPTVVLPSTAAKINAPARAAPADERQHLFAYITAHQHACSNYLATTRPRSAAWTSTNIVSSALAAAVAAGPTFGGSAFVNMLQRGLGLPDDLPLVQILCAVVFSITIVSTITANIIHTRDYATKLAAAETCYGALDSLRVELQFGAIPVVRGAEKVAKEIARTPFIIHPKPHRATT
jgi:hypothetical protein